MYFYFNIFGFNMPGYSLMFITGLFLANFIAYFIVKKNNLDINDFIICEAYTGMGAIFGSKALYLFVIRNLIDWGRIFEADYFNSLMKGGFVFYGGMIGGIITFIIGCKIHNINGMSYLRRIIFLIPFIHAFGRIGCFLAGCCYGIEYDGIFSVVFPENSYALSGIPLFPIQLLESLLLFVISAFVYFMYNKNNNRSIYAYFISYSIVRFLLEYLRYDTQRGKWLIFSTSQWISLFIFIFTLIFIFFANKEKPHTY